MIGVWIARRFLQPPPLISPQLSRKSSAPREDLGNRAGCRRRLTSSAAEDSLISDPAGDVCPPSSIATRGFRRSHAAHRDSAARLLRSPFPGTPKAPKWSLQEAVGSLFGPSPPKQQIEVPYRSFRDYVRRQLGSKPFLDNSVAPVRFHQASSFTEDARRAEPLQAP